MKGMLRTLNAAPVVSRGASATLCCATFAVLGFVFTAFSYPQTQQPATPLAQQPAIDRIPVEKTLPLDGRQVINARNPQQLAMEAWRRKIVHLPREKASACYRAVYPELAWHEVACKMIPQKANPPRVPKGIRTDQVGGNSGADFSASTINNINEAEGQFDSVTTSGTGNPTAYTLQMNTAPFNTSTCAGSTPTGIAGLPGCQGWEQFVYSTDNSGEVFIQYWILQWGPSGTTCKAPVSPSCDGAHAFTDGWCPYTLTDGSGNSFVDCVINGATNSGIGTVSTASLNNIAMTAFPEDATNASDNAIATISGVANHVAGSNEFPDLSTNWNAVEFNIFGDGGGSEAFFDPNTTIEVRTSVASNTNLGPGCAFESFTGESNNLTLVATTSNPPKGNLPSLVFTETNAGNPATAPCSSAISLGDTHIHPFNGRTEYDFQAYGDFILVETGPDFIVHTRQVPGPPDYPGTSTNSAVAVLMGHTRIAVYLQPARLVVNGKTTEIANGGTLELPGGVQVTRIGAEYFISDEKGNSVRADLVTSGSEALWMNITVGLGHSPDNRVRGLLGNPSDRADEIKTARGFVIKVPVDVKDLYGQFADSWRVRPADSLFNELPPAIIGIPLKPLTAADLNPAEKAHALAACKTAGVTNAALLDDCVLDTTVLKNDLAVRVFTKITPPKFVIKPFLHVNQNAVPR